MFEGALVIDPTRSLDAVRHQFCAAAQDST
jgi:hypothetical protein